MRTGTESGKGGFVLLLSVLAALPSCKAKRDLEHRLAAAVATLDERPTTARIAAFEYRPPPARTHAAAASKLSRQRTRARGAAEEVLTESDGGSHVAALARLVAGDARGAVDRLESLVVKEPVNAVLWSDLSAARYELATKEDDPALQAAALTAADNALRLNPAMQPALFNRALALDALALKPAALRAFDRYRTVDATSAWSYEVLNRTEDIPRTNVTQEWSRAKAMLEQGRDTESIVHRFPQQTRTAAESDYLSRWAEAFVHGDRATASRWLNVARAVGRSLAQQRGEMLLGDAVVAIESAAQPSRLADAYLLYRHGRLLYSTGKGHVIEALPLLKDAERRFGTAQSPMRLVASYYYANALFDAHRTDEARSLLDALLATTPPRYRALHAQLYWLRSTITANLGQPYASLTAGEEAAERFAQIGENENVARMNMATSTTLQMLGRIDESQRVRRRAFEAASAAGKASLWEVILNGAARDELREQRWDVAASLFAVELETEPVSPYLRCDALLWHAVAQARLKAAAQPDLHDAYTSALKISDPAIRAEIENELRFVEGVSLIQAEPVRATELLSQVISVRLSTLRVAELAAAYAERARAYQSAGRLQEAESDLRTAIGINERGGDSINRDDLRDTFFGETDSVDEQLVELLVAEGRLEEAVVAADRARARSLAERDRRHGYPTPAQRLGSLAADTPANVIIVHYTTLISKTLVCIIEHGRHTEFVIDVARKELQNLRDRLVQATIEDRRLEQEQTGRRLYDLLIRPVLERSRRHGTLTIVADDVLSGVPFALLLSPAGRFLVEDVPIMNTVSASLFVGHAAEQVTPLGRNIRFAVIADPAFNELLFPRLERLPAARKDAVMLSRDHTAIILAEQDATSSRALDAFQRAEIVHIAAHAVTNRVDAWKSAFILTPDEKSDGMLYLHQIAGRDLTRLRIVMLAGCRTAAAGGGKGSVRSLARAFLAAGSHNVVATLWDVDDSATSALTNEFYRALEKGQDVASALQTAQRFMMHSGNAAWASPKSWGGLQMQGCNT